MSNREQKGFIDSMKDVVKKQQTAVDSWSRVTL